MLLDQARILAASVRTPETVLNTLKRRLRPDTAKTYVAGTLGPIAAEGRYMMTAEQVQTFTEAVAIQNVDAPIAHFLADSGWVDRHGLVDTLAAVIVMLTPRHFATRSTQAIALPLADIEASRRADLLDLIL